MAEEKGIKIFNLNGFSPIPKHLNQSFFKKLKNKLYSEKYIRLFNHLFNYFFYIKWGYYLIDIVDQDTNHIIHNFFSIGFKDNWNDNC